MDGRGAYRHEVSTFITGWSYDRCQVCGLIYEFLERRGLPNFSNSEAHRRHAEYERKQRENNRHLGALFEVFQNRCVCDPKADAEYLECFAEKMLNQRNSEQATKTQSTGQVAPLNSGRLGTNGSTTSKTTQTSASGPDSGDLIYQLAQLTELFKSGALSKEQFEAAKNVLLGL